MQVPEAIKGMQCQVNVNGPQFYEGKDSPERIKGVSYPIFIGVDKGSPGGDKTVIRKKGVKSNDAV